MKHSTKTLPPLNGRDPLTVVELHDGRLGVLVVDRGNRVYIGKSFDSVPECTGMRSRVIALPRLLDEEDASRPYLEAQASVVDCLLEDVPSDAERGRESALSHVMPESYAPWCECHIGGLGKT